MGMNVENGLAKSTRTTRLVLATMVLVVFASVGVRIILALQFPTIPTSDFNSIVVFASALAEHGLAAKGWFWDLISPGTPVLLSLIMRAVPFDPVSTARLATTTMLGLLPLLPLLLLRGVVPARGRLLIATILAFQPAQVIFSSVVAQDNWIMLPTVALACLMVRNLWGRRGGYPVWAALLWCVAGYVREEMYLVALPLAIAACWPLADSRLKLKRILAFVSIAWLLLMGIASQRYMATGDFSLMTRHGGSSILGSYAPGAGFGWIDPRPFIAAEEPALLDPPPSQQVKRVSRSAKGELIDSHWEAHKEHEEMKLAITEILRRPGFHAIRRLGALYAAISGMDGTLEYWALTDADVQPMATEPAAAKFAHEMRPFVFVGLLLLHAFFIGAVLIALRERDPAMLVLVLVILLKIGVHLLVAMQARFFMVTDSLEALVVGLAVLRLNRNPRMGWMFVLAAAATGMLYLGMHHYYSRLQAWVGVQEWNRPALHYRFVLRLPKATAECQIDHGRLTVLNGSGGTLQLDARDPVPGDFAEVTCMVNTESTQQGKLKFEVYDGYAPGGLPDRIVQEAIVGGVVVHLHDIAAKPGTGWWSVEMPQKGQTITLRLQAKSPDSGAAWGSAAATEFRLAPATAGN